ncbi:MAG: Hsp70 family protein, partial [Candidatus Binatia bacterium]
MNPVSPAPSRYIVGIDLGTTNCAVAYIDTTRSLAVQHFPIPQLVNEATVASLPTLPSFLYLPGAHDLPAGSLALPWDRERNYAVGQFARVQGARVPGRLIFSAKSWLSHPDVDRSAAILPWGAPPEVQKLSPVEASARYLLHMREAWNQRMGKQHALETQQVILTVPASFDEVARELTVQAAEQAGLTRITLLEEPQAAFYAWLAAHVDSWQTYLQPGQAILVCDVGGGTTDLSLIAVTEGKTQLQLERVAVGDHLLLGGDNMDIALALHVEARLAKGGRLDAQRWHTLTHLCRIAKEDLFADPNRQSVTLALAGRSSAVVGGTLSDTLRREEVEQIVLDGFFSVIGPDAVPRRAARAGLQEFGLPYATEPEIPRHLALFLQQHASNQLSVVSCQLSDLPPQLPVRPDAVLFNGCALTPLA